MIITLTEKIYLDEFYKNVEEITKRKVLKPGFLGLFWGKYEIEDVMSTYSVPDYNKFRTKKIHITSNTIWKISNYSKHHTILVCKIKTRIGYNHICEDTRRYDVCETIDEIKNKLNNY